MKKLTLLTFAIITFTSWGHAQTLPHEIQKDYPEVLVGVANFTNKLTLNNEQYIQIAKALQERNKALKEIKVKDALAIKTKSDSIRNIWMEQYVSIIGEDVYKEKIYNKVHREEIAEAANNFYKSGWHLCLDSAARHKQFADFFKEKEYIKARYNYDKKTRDDKMKLLKQNFKTSVNTYKITASLCNKISNKTNAHPFTCEEYLIIKKAYETHVKKNKNPDLALSMAIAEVLPANIIKQKKDIKIAQNIENYI